MNIRKQYARQQKTFPKGTYPAQFVGTVPTPDGYLRLRFVVYNDAAEQYESFCTNGKYTGATALALLGRSSFESARHQGFTVELGFTKWEQNTVFGFYPFARFSVPPWAREVQDAWQSEGDARAEYLACRRDYDEKFRIAEEVRLETWKLYRGLVPYSNLVGTSTSDLRVYLSLFFADGMKHSNYGEWQIDHVTPLSRADLLNAAAVAKVAHWSNLRPIWKEGNLAKYNN